VAFRRLVRPVILRGVAQLLPRKRDRAADYEAVLARAGDDGADAVIEALAQESTVTDRRVYLEVLPRLQAGVPTLMHMLGDARWFIVRNAADLLGEMKVAQAEEALLPLLQHPDDRVSRSAANALVAINTPTAFRAVAEVMRDESPSARAQAAAAIAHRRDARSATTLRIALDDEPDTGVQFALLAALGKVATPDAVHRLIRASDPDRKLIGGKSSEFRVAAVEALAEAGGAAALAALESLAKDKDRAVREAATRALQLAAKSAGEAEKKVEA
jgi:HEAT repeat protein